MKKAKNAPPWTRKKLYRYRLKQKQERLEVVKEQQRRDTALAKSGEKFDRALEGIDG